MPERGRRCLLLLAVLLGGCVTAAPLASTSPSAGTFAPTASATPPTSPTASPMPTASPTPDPGQLALTATSCDGGVLLSWSASTHPDFHHYTALRSPERDVAPDYPPIAPAVDWGDTYATDPFVTSAVDASILPSDTEWNYRVMAYDANGRVVAASPVRAARMREVGDLGPLQVDAGGESATQLRWQAYDGPAECFSAYRVLYGIGSSPANVLTVVSDQAAVTVDTTALHAGTSYQLRVEVVRTTTLGSFVVARTGNATYAVP